MNTKIALSPTINLDYMNEAQRAHFKGILSNWKLQLLDETAATARMMAIGAANDADPIDRATQTEELHMEVRTQNRRRRLISKINASIDLIDHNEYGYCATCGIEIGLLRMQARLTATQCIDCKSLEELKERQVHG
jgi:DnaK suppressor protein